MMSYKEFKRIIRLDILNDTNGSGFNSFIKYLVDIKKNGTYVKISDKTHINSYYTVYKYMGRDVFDNYLNIRLYDTSYDFTNNFDEQYYEQYYEFTNKSVKDNFPSEEYIIQRDDFLNKYIREYLEFDKYIKTTTNRFLLDD